MKILYIIDKPNMYGSEQHLLDIIKKFAQFQDVSFIAFAKGEMIEHLPKIKIAIFKIRWISKLSEFLHLYEFIKNEKPDLIHCHQPKALFYGTVIGKILGIKTIITVHSRAYDHALVHENLFKRLAVFIFHNFISLISKILANKIIYVNNKMYSQSIFKYKSQYISNWLKSDIKYININKNFNRKKKINFLTVGSTSKSKGFDLLIYFFNILKKEGIDFSAKIYGHIHDDFIKNITIPGEVELCGFRNNITNSYQEANIFVLFSRSETFGLSYLEAMSQGLPIICLDLDDFIELIPNDNIKVKNITEDIVDLLQKILKKEEYEKISRINIVKSKEYSYDKKMEQLKLVYEEMSK